jgi:hypothetical protein
VRRAARVDANQAAIVETLRAAGCSVYVIGLPVDLVVGKNGHTVLAECKTKTGRYTELQTEFMGTWKGGAVATIRDIEGAITLARSLGNEERR